MTLPKIDIPTFTTKLFSIDQEITYRPFLVKEEKILYMALESGETSEMTRAMKQIIGNCVQQDLDIDNLPLFDVEYIMVNIRAKSVGENAQVIHRCQQLINEETCNNEIPLNINLERISLNREINTEPQIIMLTDDIGIQMKYPKTELLNTNVSEETGLMENLWNTLELCIDFIFDSENAYQLENYSTEEKNDFFDSLTQEQFGKVRTFFDELPRLQYTDKYKCSKCKYNGNLVIEGLDSFFV